MTLTIALVAACLALTACRQQTGEQGALPAGVWVGYRGDPFFQPGDGIVVALGLHIPRAQCNKDFGSCIGSLGHFLQQR